MIDRDLVNALARVQDLLEFHTLHSGKTSSSLAEGSQIRSRASLSQDIVPVSILLGLICAEPGSKPGVLGPFSLEQRLLGLEIPINKFNHIRAITMLS